MKHFKVKMSELVNIAAILVTIASLLASVCWISAGKAGSQSDDQKTSALGFMMLRLEAETETSTSLVQAQSYLTQAGMYYAEADSTDDKVLKSYLNSIGNDSIEFANLYKSSASNSSNRSKQYINKYNKTIALATTSGKLADYRSTGALIFNVSAIIASGTVLFKRKELLYVYILLFILGLYYLILSLL
jgi:hypothetical protein